MNTQITELVAITQEVSWLVWAVQYFFLIAVSIGGVILSLPAFLLGRHDLEPMGRVALIVALTTGLVAPVALLSDLHQPFRFYHFYTHFDAESWMAWGSLFLPLYIGSLLLYGLLALRGVGGAVTRLLAATTLLGAALVALYTGSEMGVLISRPLWNSPWMGILFVVTGISGAAGLALLLERWVFPHPVTARPLQQALSVTLIVGALLQLVWALTGGADLSSSGASWLRLATDYMPVEVIGYGLLLGTLVPLLLTRLDRAPLLAALLALFGAWMFRWNMFIGGQGIPKSGAGFYPFEMPVGAEGWAGIIGSAGLWLFLLLVVLTLFPTDSSSKQA